MCHSCGSGQPPADPYGTLRRPGAPACGSHGRCSTPDDFVAVVENLYIIRVKAHAGVVSVWENEGKVNVVWECENFTPFHEISPNLTGRSFPGAVSIELTALLLARRGRKPHFLHLIRTREQSYGDGTVRPLLGWLSYICIHLYERGNTQYATAQPQGGDVLELGKDVPRVSSSDGLRRALAE